MEANQSTDAASQVPTTDAGSAVDGGDPEECGPDVEGCTCSAPSEGAPCTHSFGGVYPHQGCSASYQCCDGVFSEGIGSCGACSCTETTGTDGCAAMEERCFPSFQGSAEAIPADMQEDMIGKSWHAELACPPFADLRLLRVDHWGFDGAVQKGELIVSAAAASSLLSTLETLYDAGFAIERMERIDVYGGDDDASMEANNTSAFNCRAVTGGTTLSAHASGEAIDINPVQNPYVRNSTVLPPAGQAFLDRGNRRMGMIGAGDVVVQAFGAIGWTWGGTFSSLKDYQHFSLSGG